MQLEVRDLIHHGCTLREIGNFYGVARENIQYDARQAGAVTTRPKTPRAAPLQRPPPHDNLKRARIAFSELHGACSPDEAVRLGRTTTEAWCDFLGEWRTLHPYERRGANSHAKNLGKLETTATDWT
jgi:hypothetical protein